VARAVTSKDVARAAGVSQSTVSYVMSGKRPISEKTRRVVEDAIAELTYQPNAGARALAGRRTQIVAVVMPVDNTLGAAGFMAFVEEITLVARQHDHDVLMVTADEGLAGLQRVAGRALCDAIVVMDVRSDDPRAALARELPLPTLLIGVPDDTDGLHCIDFDFEAGARLLVDELADAGHDRIAVLGWGPRTLARNLNFVPRFRSAALDQAAARGLVLDWIVPAAETLEQQVAEVLEAGVRGLVLATSPARALNAVQDSGFRPGRDIDVVALATHAEATAFPVHLSNVSQHPRDVSRQAMEWLFALLDDPSGETGVRRVPAELVRRASVRTH
jgi:DNA-binding LacI/PurR family transcriptional regulator